MWFVPLSSGSRGNSLLVRGEAGALLIDAGLHRRDLLLRLRAVGHRPEDLDGILVTHRHLDHVRGAAPLARRFKLPLFATEATALHQQRKMLRPIDIIHPGVPFRVAGYRVHPVQVSHDAPQTVAFLVEAGDRRLGVATDLGSTGGAIQQVFTRLDALYLEFNHDLPMLKSGPYSWELKHRIASPRGHLSNAQAGRLLGHLASPRLRNVYLAHLSEVNNTPALAMAAARRGLGDRDDVRVRIAAQHGVSEGVEL